MGQRIIDTNWGSTGDAQDPGVSMMNDGFVAQIPKHEHQNFWQLRADDQMQYSQRHGIDSWDALIIFLDDAIVMGSDAVLYQSQQATNTNHQPVGDDGTWWRPLIQTSNIGGAVYGLELANDSGGDVANDIIIAPGGCPAMNVFNPNFITKRLDAVFSAGSGGGGLNTGVASADETYNVHMIRKDDTGVLDYYIATDPSGTVSVPAGYTWICRVSAVPTKVASAEWILFENSGNHFTVDTSGTRESVPQSASPQTLTLLAFPKGVRVMASLTVIAETQLNGPSGVDTRIYRVGEIDGQGEQHFHMHADFRHTGRINLPILTNTLGQFRCDSDTNDPGYTIRYWFEGWEDQLRGMKQ